MNFNLAAAALVFAGTLCCSRAVAAAPDHIVIVIEENEAPSAILGSPNAPFINSLAAGGASFTNFYSVTHPSQPNYLHLYSGASQGVFDDSPLSGTFSTPNLGAELLAAGKSFAGYFEDLPAPGSTTSGSGKYSRRHNPIVDWQSNNPGPNQYDASHNLPFTSFPTDFNQLPTVSFVIPNGGNDMHDAPVGVGDAWLANNLGAYAQWAQTHNSLLIVTWDEDDFLGRNRIVNLFSGQMVQPGSQPQATWTHHNLLRTIEDMYGTTHAGAAARVRPIVGAFVGDAQTITTTYRDNDNGYQSSSDTFIESANPSTAHGSDAILSVKGGNVQGLLRFDSLFGFGANQTPPGAKIISAKLLVPTNDATIGAPDTISIHRMLTAWTEISTWQSLTNGVSTDDVEAVSTPEFGLTPNVAGAPAIFDVSDSLALWSADPTQNKGWMMRGNVNTWSWNWKSSETADAALRPSLEITYERPHWNLDADGSWSSAGNWISGLPTGAGAKANFLRNISAPRMIQMGAAITTGSLTFDSPVSYTLNGTGLSLSPLSDVPSRIDVLSGSHTITATVTVQDDTPINVASGARLEMNKLNIAVLKTVAKVGGGTLRIAGGVQGGPSALNVNEGTLETGSLRFLYVQIHGESKIAILPATGNNGTSRLASLSFDGSSGNWQGQLDLANNSMVVTADAVSRMAVLARLADQIGTARNRGAGLWTGAGLTSSSAAASGGIMGLGILLNDNGAGGVRYSTFAGQTVDINTILVKYTLVGDMDLDGDVDADDYSKIDAGYAQQLGGYWNGDLDYNGRINSDDFFLIDRAYASVLYGPPAGFPAPSAAVPEPGTLGMGIFLAAIFALRLRWVCFSTPSSPAPARGTSGRGPDCPGADQPV